MHPTGQGHDVSTPPSLDASWTVAQAPLERNSLVSSAEHTIKLTSGHPCNVILSAVPVVFIYQANVAEPPVLIATVGIVLVEYNVSTVLSPPNMEES